MGYAVMASLALLATYRARPPLGSCSGGVETRLFDPEGLEDKSELEGDEMPKLTRVFPVKFDSVTYHRDIHIQSLVSGESRVLL